MPDDLAVGRVEERNSVAPIIERAVRYTFRVAFGLSQNTLRPKSQLLRFDDSKNLAVRAKGIIGGAVGGLELLDGATLVGIKGCVRLELDNAPPRRFQLGVNKPLSGQPLRVVF